MDILLDGVLIPAPAALAASMATVVAPPTTYMVPKLRAVDRVISAGLGSALIAALDSDAIAKLRFQSAVEFASDDAQVRGVLTSIGADPDSVLAP